MATASLSLPVSLSAPLSASFAALASVAAALDDPEKRPAVVSSGFRSLDAILPDGGIRRGSLVEWLVPCGVGEGAIVSSGSASGGITLACAVAVGGLCGRSGGAEMAGPSTVVIVDRQGRFHPPAVFPWMSFPRMGRAAGASSMPGQASADGRCRLIVARPSKDDDEAWAIDQALRCPGVAAVVAWPRRIHPTAMRRWQLAARSSGAVGLIARKAEDRREPSWAHVRLAVTPLAIRGEAMAGRFPVGGAGMRAWRVATVAGPIDFEERAAVVGFDLAAGLETTGLEIVRAPERQRREAMPCHAS